MTSASICKGDQCFVVGLMFFCSFVSTTTHTNQQCHLSGLGLFSDGEEGLYAVSFKLSTALIGLQWLGLQSVADIKVVKNPLRVLRAQ